MRRSTLRFVIGLSLLIVATGATALVTTTTSIVTASPVSPSVYTQPVTFSCTVTSSGGTPTGSINFLDGTTVIKSATLGGGFASATITTLGVGTHQIKAKYVGNATFATSTSASALAFTVNKAVSAISLVTSPSTSTLTGEGTATATVTTQSPATVNPAGSVTFFDGATAIRTVSVSGSGTTTTASIPLSLLLPSQSCHNLTASYSGTGTVLPAGPTNPAICQTISKGSTTVTLTPSGTFNHGQSVLFNIAVAAVAPASGTPTGQVSVVSSLDGTIATLGLNGAGLATFSTSTLSSGTHTITATYLGNTKFLSGGFATS